MQGAKPRTASHACKQVMLSNGQSLNVRCRVFYRSNNLSLSLSDRIIMERFTNSITRQHATPTSAFREGTRGLTKVVTEMLLSHRRRGIIDKGSSHLCWLPVSTRICRSCTIQKFFLCNCTTVVHEAKVSCNKQPKKAIHTRQF